MNDLALVNRAAAGLEARTDELARGNAALPNLEQGWQRLGLDRARATSPAFRKAAATTGEATHSATAPIFSVARNEHAHRPGNKNVVPFNPKLTPNT